MGAEAAVVVFVLHMAWATATGIPKPPMGFLLLLLYACSFDKLNLRPSLMEWEGKEGKEEEKRVLSLGKRRQEEELEGCCLSQLLCCSALFRESADGRRGRRGEGGWGRLIACVSSMGVLIELAGTEGGVNSRD